VTEFDLAFSFLQSYIKAAVAAAEVGESVDDAAEFRRHCAESGVEPTEQRVELVRDLAGVLKECLAEDDSDEEDGETARTIAGVCLLDGLERHGWRLAFLDKDVQD
jgi:hypothetical protein